MHTRRESAKKEMTETQKGLYKGLKMELSILEDDDFDLYKNVANGLNPMELQNLKRRLKAQKDKKQSDFQRSSKFKMS